MSKIQQVVSDLSGEVIADGDSARIVVNVGDDTFTLDVSKAEALEIGSKGHKSKRRGRKPKA
jgi:hypothetical protein